MSILLEFVMERSLKKTINTFDRLTNLPDNIIHDILSLLRIRDIACVCTLSRRLRQLCFSVPSLNIFIDRFLKTPIEQQKYNNFTAYIERFWQLRSNNREYLHCLRIANLHRDLNHDMDVRIVTWIYNATMCHVQELDLDIVVYNTCCLPFFTLNCTSLWVLKLGLHSFPLKLPNAEFNSLQDLSLKSFRIVDPLLGEWISSNCKAITSLSLRSFCGASNLNITSSCLQDLKIETMTCIGYCYCQEGIRVSGNCWYCCHRRSYCEGQD
ncbi:unnamed protein product [Camellia sinensis]